jgi:hypothetical protein
MLSGSMKFQTNAGDAYPPDRHVTRSVESQVPPMSRCASHTTEKPLLIKDGPATSPTITNKIDAPDRGEPRRE